LIFHPSHLAILAFCGLCLPHAAYSHPDHDTEPGSDSGLALRTGNGHWTFEAVPHWGELPDDKPIGPTHGGVVINDTTGEIFVSTDSLLSVLVYNADGELLRTIAPECQGFHAMALREEDETTVIYGAQLNGAGNHARREAGEPETPLRICKINTKGELLLEIPNENTSDVPGGWGGLTAVTVAPDGSIFAAMGYGSQMIHKFDQSGKLLLSFGGPGDEDGKFNTAHGLAIDLRFDQPRLLVVDRENRRLCHLDLDGQWIGVHASNLRRPCAATFFGEFTAIAELEARVTILDRNGTPVAFLGDNPDPAQWANFGVPPEAMSPAIFTAPHGLSFDKNANLYVQDWNQTGRVTKLHKLLPTQP